MEDGNGILSFNGEIYNYLEIKKNSNFDKFKTNSDTEIIAQISFKK